MQPQDRRSVLWIRAVEDGDGAGELFPFDERGKATSQVAPQAPGEPQPRMPKNGWAGFLGDRAKAAQDYLTNRHGELGQPPATESGRARLVVIAAIVLALVLGLLSDRLLGGQGTINVISLPLIGILVWSLIIYIWNAFSLFAGNRADGVGLHAFLAPLAKVGVSRSQPDLATPPTLWEKIRGNYLRRWSELAQPSRMLKLSAGLHLAAAAFAVGQIISLYLRGLVRHYRAVWESTFLDAEGFEQFANILFKPAHWLTRIPVEVSEQMDASQFDGVPAKSWIHLCAATLLLLVVVPRIILALISNVRAHARMRSAIGGLGLPDYANDLLKANTKGGLQVAVVTCGIDLPDNAPETIRQSIQQAIGKPQKLEFISGPSYGEEDGFARSLIDAQGRTPNLVVLIFPMTATPEEEIQGVIAEEISDLVGSRSGDRTGAIAFLYLDRFREKMGGLPEYDERLSGRQEVWNQVLVPRGVRPILWSTGDTPIDTGHQITRLLEGDSTESPDTAEAPVEEGS